MPQRKHPVPPYALHEQLAADTHPLATWSLCDVRLMDDSNYPWLVLVPRVADVREMIELQADPRRTLVEEIDCASRLLRDVFRPFKLNVAALGNLVPQLHVHVIARYQEDPAWPKPVWGTAAARPYEPEELVRCVERLQAALAG